jgi:hydroxyethylthiazole kinase-like uncharacterized protein yjeF
MQHFREVSMSANEDKALPAGLYTAAESRELDRLAVAGTQLTSLQLMELAAEAALNLLLELWPGTHRLCVLVGTGNNGGDGYLLAQLALERHLAVRVIEVGQQERLVEVPRMAKERARQAGASFECFSPSDDLGNSRDVVIVDALLGTGIKSAPRGDFPAAIAWINASKMPVLAIDVPSGLCSDTGVAVGEAVHADATVSFIGLKRGLFTGVGPELCGQIFFRSLGVGAAITRFEYRGSVQSRLDFHTMKSVLGRRSRTDHKGRCGSVVVLGGDVGFGGAAIMAAEAAARSGAGTVTLITRSLNVAAAQARRPEIMCLGVDALDEQSQNSIKRHVERADSVVIGPGLGRDDWGQQILSLVLRAVGKSKPLVVDADALNLLAQQRTELLEMSSNAALGERARQNWVLTPHPGEAARLLQCTTQQIEQDRFLSAQRLQGRWGGCCVLKGAGSILCYRDALHVEHIDVCTEGNPGMASGGMGDVLSGIIGALLAQGLSVNDSAKLGVCVHGEAADLAAEQDGERGLLATDLFPYIRRLLNEC